MTEKEINRYITSICKHLKEEYGEIRDEWKLTINILRYTLHRLMQVQEEIKRNGLFDNATFKKNPLLSTEKDLMSVILKISQKLGISPWDASKIKVNDDEESPSDFINDLIS